MVEKIDRPEIKSPYYINASEETKEDGRGKGESKGDEYSGLTPQPGWQKIYSASANRQYVKLPHDSIARIWFRGTTMQRGVSLAEVDIATKDGRVFRRAHVTLNTREDFWTLKKFMSGEEIPINLVSKLPELEISVPVERNPAQEQSAQEKGQNQPEPRPNRHLALYGVIGLLLLLIVILLIRIL